MRKIKFRVWDTEENKFREMGFMINQYGSLMQYGEFEKMKKISRDRYKILQYTGLKDKNGKEIYEGDIIEMQHCKKCNGLKAIVKRYWDGWWYFTEEETKGRMGEMVSQYVANFDEKFEKLSYCIVIGNKYENPELLGGK